MVLEKLNFVSKVNLACLIIIAIFLFWLMIQFPETQSEYSNKIFQQAIEQAQSNEDIKKAAKNFSQTVKYTQGAAKLIGLATILTSFSMIVLLTTNYFAIKKLKRLSQENKQ